jgi:hypothetical protein
MDNWRKLQEQFKISLDLQLSNARRKIYGFFFFFLGPKIGVSFKITIEFVIDYN